MSENTEPTKESIQESLPETESQEVVSEEEVITASHENTEQQTAQTVSENADSNTHLPLPTINTV